MGVLPKREALKFGLISYFIVGFLLQQILAPFDHLIDLINRFIPIIPKIGVHAYIFLFWPFMIAVTSGRPAALLCFGTLVIAACYLAYLKGKYISAASDCVRLREELTVISARHSLTAGAHRIAEDQGG